MPMCNSSENKGDDTVERDASQKNHWKVIADNNQKAYDNETGVSVAGLLSTRKPEVTQRAGDTQKSQRSAEDFSTKEQLDNGEDLMRPPPKRQKNATTSSSTAIEAIDLSEELPMWNERVDTPQKPQPKVSSAGKRHKGQKRTRNNFTDYEKEHAPAWFKSQMDAGKLPADIEKAYQEKFGVFHRWLTLKLWVDRLDKRAAEAEPRSKIVILKVRLPQNLQMAFLNDNPS